ncbi:putative cation transporter [Pullulanibacillus pueri]|uniref:Cation transporter n=1 Tax=Pullulanibacillus pueri TaxID=1437324 RepID=A0A8J2ZU70_9BACL|nr:DUF1646 family protein [Pullulanibacillus pueri]MBM7681397.1 putative cation transporter [Pullulanibacillus pueri]GGH78722.1 hypothetical protein GCM10007096_12580 [Pullulanibacillus pueri]
MISILIFVFLLVLFLPLTVNIVENNLEVFLFFMGLLTIIISGGFTEALFAKAAQDPIKIAVAVFIAGLLFRWLQAPLERVINGCRRLIPHRLFIAFSVLFLGLISSVITAIIAALVMVIIVTTLKMDRRSEVRFVVLSCFSIGLGAALTPIGEPLATLVVGKLHKHFFFLMQLIGPEVFVALLMFSILAALLVKPPTFQMQITKRSNKREGYEDIFVRALKIYFFVMGLEFLGEGFEPLINTFLVNLNPALLYWINMISAVLDNATLSAAEVSRTMGPITLKAILLGLLISGGMLIPGNIPNIISAGKLKITSLEWAKFGVPLGLIFMMIFYLSMFKIIL